MSKLNCAARPCASCPYRKDAPSGLWEKHEYDKLLAYDGDIIDQLYGGATGVFMCHQRDGHLCAGWVAAHGSYDLLALRMSSHLIDPSVWGYETDVSVFSSGKEARKHGLRDMKRPGPKTLRLLDKLLEKRKTKA